MGQFYDSLLRSESVQINGRFNTLKFQGDWEKVKEILTNVFEKGRSDCEFKVKDQELYYGDFKSNLTGSILCELYREGFTIYSISGGFCGVFEPGTTCYIHIICPGVEKDILYEKRYIREKDKEEYVPTIYSRINTPAVKLDSEVYYMMRGYMEIGTLG